MSVRLSRVKALRRFTVRAHLPDRLTALERLSINLRWSWDKPTQDLFEAIDPELWKHVGCDPVALLGQIAPSGWTSWPRTSRSCAASTSWPLTWTTT